MGKKILPLLAALVLTPFTAVQAGGGEHFTDYARVTHVEPLYRYVTVRKPQRHCTIVKPNRHNSYWHGANGRHNGNRHRSNQRGVFVDGIVIGNLGREANRSVNGGIRFGTQRNSSISQSRSNRSHRYNQRHKPREHCVTTTVSRQERRSDGYNVTYVYKGNTFQTHTTHAPGRHIRVRIQIKPH